MTPWWKHPGRGDVPPGNCTLHHQSPASGRRFVAADETIAIEVELIEQGIRALQCLLPRQRRDVASRQRGGVRVNRH